MTDKRPVGRFYPRWVLVNGWSESIGLGTTLAIARFVVPLLPLPTGAFGILVDVATAVALGALLEGALVGAAQEGVLRMRLPELPRYRWALATVVGAAAAWILGMVASTIMAFTDEPPGMAPEDLGAISRYGLAAALGIMTGPVLGVAQWAVLRQYVDRAWDWLWANALAWAVGMLVIFIGMDLVPWTASALVVCLAMYVVCGAAGLAVGSIHGVVLSRLLERVHAVQVPQRAA